MADDLNLVLKAMLNVAESKKDIKLVINSLNQSSDLGKIKLGAEFDVSGIKKDLKDVQTAFKEIYVDGDIKKEISTIENSIGKLTKITKTFNKEGIINTEELTTNYKKQNEQRKKAVQLEKELSIASEKFTVKNLSDMYKLGDNLDITEVQKIRDSFSKIDINPNGSNLKEVLNEVKLLNKQYDVLTDKAKLQQKINKDKVKDIETEKELRLEIARILNNLPEDDKINKDMAKTYLNQLNNTTGLDSVKNLKDDVENYYKDVISLEQQYNNLKLKASKDEQDRLDFLYQQNKKLLSIKEQIRVAETTKGLNTNPVDTNGNSINSTMVSLESQLNSITEKGVVLTKEKKQQIVEISDKIQQQLKYQNDDLAIINQKENVYKKINANLDKLNSVKIKNANVDGLTNSWKDLDTRIKSGVTSIQDAKIEMNGLEASTKKATATTGGFGLSLKNLFKYATFYDALAIGKQALRSIVTEVKALDDSLLEVNKIINLTDREMQNFVKTSYAMGDSLSRTGRDVIDSTATILKAGLGDNLTEAMDYASLSLSMKNVGEDMTDVESNANILISTMKGFGDESVAFAEKTVNILNKVSNESSVTFADLAEGFARTSAVFSQSGVSIEQTAGLLTGANEILQNIEKSSSGLLTISQRIQGVSESFTEDPENLSKLDTALKEIANVDIQDTTGQLRDTYSILNDINEVYPTLTKNQQAYLGELIAG